MPCQQTLSPSKGTDTHLILHWTDPGAKLAHSGTRQALALVSKAHDRSSRKGRTETVLSCHIIPCLCQDRQLMLPTAQGKMDFSTQKAFKSLQGQYCFHRNQLYCTDIKVHENFEKFDEHQSMRTFMNSCKCQKCWISTKGLETSGCEQKHLNTTAGEEQEEIPWRDSWSVYSQTDCQALGFHAQPCLAATPSFVSRSEFYLCGQKKRRWYIERKTYSQ